MKILIDESVLQRLIDQVYTYLSEYGGDDSAYQTAISLIEGSKRMRKFMLFIAYKNGEEYHMQTYDTIQEAVDEGYLMKDSGFDEDMQNIPAYLVKTVDIVDITLLLDIAS